MSPSGRPGALKSAEVDDGTREQNRVDIGEPYRTLLGHFRHEIGHYYWDKLDYWDKLVRCSTPPSLQEVF
jgi:hypothetical protein